jgi:hypothetical protein
VVSAARLKKKYDNETQSSFNLVVSSVLVDASRSEHSGIRNNEMSTIRTNDAHR